MAAKFGASPKSLDYLIGLASRFSGSPEGPHAGNVLADPGLATGATSVAPGFIMPTASKADVRNKCSAPAPGAPVHAHDDIMAFAKSAASSDVERKIIRVSTARQKLQVFALFVAAAGKSSFQALRQADVKKFVDVMAMLPKVRGRSSAPKPK